MGSRLVKIMDPLSQLTDWPARHNQAGWAAANGAQTTSSDPYQVFELASITKLLFSMAVLVAYEEGSLSLSEPLDSSGYTVSDLLAHAAGFGAEKADGMKAKPKKKRAYSNYGFETIGSLLKRSTGLEPADYFREAVAEPLGLSRTEIYGSVARQSRSCVADLLVVGTELLRPTLITTETLRRATSPHLPGLDGILPGFGFQSTNSWGLGFEIKGTKTNHWMAVGNSPQSFGHFGQAGTFLWIDPLADICCAALSDKDFGPWAKVAWPKFSQAVLDYV